MWHSYIFRKCCKFWHHTPLSCQKRCSKIQKIWHQNEAPYGQQISSHMLSAQLWYFPGAPFVFGIWDAHFDWQANCWALWHKRHSNHRVVFTDNCPVVESYTRSLRTNKSPKSLTKFWSQGFTKHYWLAKIGRRFWKLKLQESLVKKTGAKNQPWSLKLICWKTFQSQFYHSLLSQ